MHPWLCIRGGRFFPDEVRFNFYYTSYFDLDDAKDNGHEMDAFMNVGNNSSQDVVTNVSFI